MSNQFNRKVDEEAIKAMNRYVKKCYMGESADVYIHPNASRIMVKSDDPVVGGTTGYDWANRGPQIYSTINQDAKVWGILNSKPFGNRGLTMITDDETTSDAYADGGATVETDHPTLANVDLNLKQVQSRTAYTEIEELYAKSNGRNVRDILKQYYAKRHLTKLSEFMMAKVDTYDTLGATEDPTSLDRLISSFAEMNSVGYTSTNIDVYSLGTTRSSGASVYDAYVDYGAAGVTRTFDYTMIDTLLNNIEDAGGDISKGVFLTGRDTKTRWGQQLGSKQQFNDTMKTFKATINGIVESREGVEGSFDVSTYEGIPIMTSIKVPKDTLSRIYYIPLDNVWKEIGKPTQWFELFDPNANAKFDIITTLRTVFEVRVADFGVCGKIRDLK